MFDDRISGINYRACSIDSLLLQSYRICKDVIVPSKSKSRPSASIISMGAEKEGFTESAAPKEPMMTSGGDMC
jgi:hypothetical protein